MGMWFFAGVGFLACVFALVLAFVPPSQLPIGSPGTYIATVAIGGVVFVAVPFLIERAAKPSWIPEDQVRYAAMGPSDQDHPDHPANPRNLSYAAVSPGVAGYGSDDDAARRWYKAAAEVREFHLSSGRHRW